MKKILNKSLNIFLILVLLVISFTTPVYRVKAQTIGDLKANLAAKQAEYDKQKQQKELTEKEQQEIKNKISANENKIISLKQENESLTDDIAKLNKSMEEKYTEIKKIINSEQIDSGEASYLEYIFGATSFTDFIYRASVAEQLSKYNKQLIDEYNKEIDESKAKQDEIAKKQVEIANIQVELNSEYSSLGQEVANISDDMLSTQEEVKLLQDNITKLQSTYGCSDDEDIEACKERARRSTYIPASTGAFKRPIINAVVTANYGYYDPYHTGRTTWHAAMDLAGDSGSKIYAAAAGKVVSVTHKSCGNNVVYIVHNINGVRYTTGYWHMRKAYVSEGDYVTQDEVIGIQGGLSSEDSCSTGEHLDFVITLGAYTIDYLESPRSVSVNPRNYLYFPPLIEGAYTGIGTSTEWTTR